MPYADPAKRKAQLQSWYLRNREMHKERCIKRRAALSTEIKRRYRKSARARYVAKGLTASGKPRKPSPLPSNRIIDALADANAKQAWKYWLTIAPDWWMEAHFAVGDRPWRNPRLTPAESRVLRYSLDESFKRRELDRLKIKKKRHRKEIAEAPSDLMPGEYEHLRETAEICVYCGCELTANNRTLDHVVPLSKGGEHSHGNLEGACRSCNGRKQDRLGIMPIDFQGTSRDLDIPREIRPPVYRRFSSP